MSDCNLLPHWALENWTGKVSRIDLLFLVLLLFLCNCVVVDVHLSLCIHNYRWTTTKLHSNNNNNNTTKRSIYINCSIFLFWLLLLLLCNFVAHLSLCIHNYRWTTTKTKFNSNNNNKKINLHKLLNFQELISPTFQCMTYLSNSWPANEQMQSWPDIVLLLTTRCLYRGVHLSDVLGTSENLNTLCVLCFASQRSFLRKTNNVSLYLNIKYRMKMNAWKWYAARKIYKPLWRTALKE